MASITDIPFNFNPVSVSVQSGSFTVPTGKYAFIMAEAWNGGTFTIDGVTALFSLTPSSPTAGVAKSATNTTSVSHTVSSGKYFIGQAFSDGGDAEITVDGVIAPLDSPIHANAGQTITASTPANERHGISGIEFSITTQVNDRATGSFWVPPGTVLDGSGGFRYVVSQFNA